MSSPYLPKVRRNQPRGSKIGLKVRTRQNLRRSSRSRSGRYQGTNGNLYCIFCLKNDMNYANESARRNEVEPSALHFWAQCSTHKLSTLTFGRTLSLFTKRRHPNWCDERAEMATSSTYPAAQPALG